MMSGFSALSDHATMGPNWRSVADAPYTASMNLPELGSEPSTTDYIFGSGRGDPPLNGE
jgi:hypothetical protein